MGSSAKPWRLWCKDNHVGQNYGWRAIAEGKLKVRRIGKRMLVLDKDGLAFLESLPSGPPAMPESFRMKVVK
jgi:hypothetical protein